MTELTGMVGFSSHIAEKRRAKRHTLGLELIATVALAVSLIVAATAVSIGMARARTLGAIAQHHDALDRRPLIAEGVNPSRAQTLERNRFRLN